MYRHLFGLLALVTLGSGASLERRVVENFNHDSQGKSLRFVAQGRIIGGRSVDIALHPHQISIRRKISSYSTSPHEHDCGGSLVSSTMAVTAAHCVIGRRPTEFHIVAGSSLREGSDGVIVPLKHYILHESFTTNDAAGDIALLILSTPLPLNNITIKAIELSAHVARVGAMATVTGWGLTGTAGYADVLQEIRVPIISNELCSKDFKPGYSITDGMMCAGLRGLGGEDACDGDSGGPLVINGKLAGIVSWGIGCGSSEYPGVYTRISYYLEWLLEKIAEHQ